MRFLIVGGAGFIGSNLVDYLLENNQEVMIVDNFLTGSVNNIEQALVDKNFHLCEHSKVKLRYITQTDFIIVLSASVGVDYLERNPRDSVLNNLDTLKKILYLNSNVKAKKPLLYASSSEVYGNSSKIPFKENQDLSIGNPEASTRWGYSCSKLMGEFLVRAYLDTFPSVIIRPFNIFGPKQVSDYGMVIPSFIEKCIKNEDIEIYGDGSQTRCFCYIKDAVKAITSLIVTKRCYGSTFNIGNPKEEITMLDLAAKIRYGIFTDSTSGIDRKIKRNYRNNVDVLRRVPSIDKVKQYISWKPKYTLAEALIETSSYYKKIIK